MLPLPLLLATRSKPSTLRVNAKALRLQLSSRKTATPLKKLWPLWPNASSGAEGQEEESVLLLGDDVENKTIPLILCAQEDVKGNHGATIGELDEETMFYFGARGIDKEAAERIVTGAKLEHICDLMKDEAAEKIAKEALEEVI